MLKYSILFVAFSLLLTTHLSSAVTVLGNTDAATCFNHAKMGYSSKSSIITCRNVFSEKAVTKDVLAGTRVNLGIIYNNGLKPTLALKEFKIAILNKSVESEALLNQGNSLFLLNDLYGALEKYDESLKLNIRDSSAVFFNKGLVFEKMNNMKEAVRFYKKAISLNPDLVLFFNKKKQLIKDGVWDKINEREES